MATLNIKALPEPIMRRLRARAQRRSVTQEAIAILDEMTRTPRTRSILELEGLGKRAWRGVDASAHVKAERDSWA